MTIVLASAWHPRGELSRFRSLLPLLKQVYASMTVALPPDADPAVRDSFAAVPGMDLFFTPDWSWGRYAALQKAAADSFGSHIQYTDFDRLLRWVEKKPDEWRQAATAAEESECLVVGRTPGAYETHPRALRETEAISNRVVSSLIGREMDVSAGCKGFSFRAAEFLLTNCRPGYALGVDGEWPVLLKRAGFPIDYIEVDGLDWESADRYQTQAAGFRAQRQEAAAYDRHPENWAARVRVAHEIVERALDAAVRPLPG